LQKAVGKEKHGLPNTKLNWPHLFSESRDSPTKLSWCIGAILKSLPDTKYNQPAQLGPNHDQKSTVINNFNECPFVTSAIMSPSVMVSIMVPTEATTTLRSTAKLKNWIRKKKNVR
jgi:hypothetical protein